MKHIFSIIATLILILSACKQTEVRTAEIKTPTTILISKAHAKKNYQKWLLHYDSTAVIHHLYEKSWNEVDSLLKVADGILISGGEDVNPAEYGKEDEIDRCGKINLKRDSLELKMIHYAMQSKTPLLGICRGEQITNVANGGSLIIDIPTDVGTSVVHRGTDSTKAYHPIDLEKNTLLYKIAQGKTDSVRSSHHQAVDQLAPIFRASAFSPDGVIEAIELKDTTSHPFLIGVQWHPEKMEYDNALSGCFAQAFLKAAAKKQSYQH